MPTATGPAEDHKRVLIEGPQSCEGCHRDASKPEPAEFRTAAQRIQMLGKKPQPTWASADCTTCHRYHWTRPPTKPAAPSTTTSEGVALLGSGSSMTP